MKVIASLQSIAAGLRFWDKPEHAQGVLAFAFEGDARASTRRVGESCGNVCELRGNRVLEREPSSCFREPTVDGGHQLEIN